MARRRQDEQHEILTPEVVQRLREATLRSYEEWWDESFGKFDFSTWDRYREWLLKELKSE